jgi:phosphoribosylaminoimidazolecarboxamide formyltransferase/IMP cyclohydrolase
MAERAALIAVYDKTGVVELARGLVELGFAIVSTGGTAKTLKAGGVRVQEVARVTGFPEILDGRVKTLHPKIFGGILARPTPAHRRQLRVRGIAPIDVVAVNLYPFEETIRKRGVTPAEAIEQIDIGGVALLRAAAKNYERVAVLSSPGQYAEAVAKLAAEEDDVSWRRGLAAEAFAATASYDAAIATWFATPRKGAFPDRLFLNYVKALEPGYGENPHQHAAFYTGADVGLRQLAGPPPSYNNFLDLAAAVSLAREFDEPACAVVKHNSPSGAAVAPTLAEAFQKAWNADAMSAYGGIVAFNKPVDMACAEAMMVKGTFFHICAAPSYARGVVAYLQRAKAWTDRLRIFAGTWKPERLEARTALGGLLLQETDGRPAGRDEFRQVAGPAVGPEVLRDLKFAMAVAKVARSNAIVVARDGVTLSIGAGQVNRYWPAVHAAQEAGENARGAVAASDGFFPKPDSLEVLCRAGVRAVVQPSGSKSDDASITTANNFGVALFFASRRHFRH